MDEQRDQLRVELTRTEPAGPGISRGLVVIVVLLALALTKPWEGGRSIEPPTTGNVNPDDPIAQASPSAAAPSVVSVQCAAAGGWRVFALGSSSPAADGRLAPVGDRLPDADIGNPRRRWLWAEPLAVADGPMDPAIPFVTIVSDQIAGLGYCAPPDGSDPPPPEVTVDAWSLDRPGEARVLPLRSVRAGDRPKNPAEGVYVPASVERGATRNWPSGRYVFEVHEAHSTGPGYERWFGVEIVQPPGKSNGSSEGPAPAERAGPFGQP